MIVHDENIFSTIENLIAAECEHDMPKGLAVYNRETVWAYSIENHDCKYEVPEFYTDDKKRKRKHKSKNTEYSKMIERHKDDLFKNEYGDDDMRETHKMKDKQIVQIAYKDINGKCRTIDSYTKGSTSYHWKNCQKIKKRTEAIFKKNAEALFITFTCNPKKYGNNRGEAWKEWKKELDKTLDAMRKKTGFLYVCVLEATNNLYPHAHIMGFFPKGTFKKYDRLPFKQNIVFGEVRKFVQHYAKKQIFNVQKPKPDEVVNYMVKYISKSTSEMISKAKDNKGNLSKDVRKATASWECPAMFHYKQVRMSLCPEQASLKLYTYFEEKTQGEKELKEGVKLHFALMSRTKFEEICRTQGLSENALKQLRAECEVSAAARRRYLIYLCINSECHRKKDVRGVSNEHFRRLYKEALRLNKGEKPSKYDLIMKNCPKDVCSGCLHSDLEDIAMGNLDNNLNISYYYCVDLSENGEERFGVKKKKFVTEEDYENDAVLLCKLGKILNDFYLYKMGGGKSYVKFRENYIERQLKIQKAFETNLLRNRYPEHWKKYCEEERKSAVVAMESKYTELDFDFCDKNAMTVEYIEKTVRTAALSQITIF